MHDVDPRDPFLPITSTVPLVQALGVWSVCWGDEQVDKPLEVRGLSEIRGRERPEQFRRESDSGERRQNGEASWKEGNSDRTGKDGKNFEGGGPGGKSFLMEGAVYTET